MCCGHVGQDHSNILQLMVSLCNCGCSNIKLWLRITPWDVHRIPSLVLLYPRQLKYTQHNALFSYNTRKPRQYSTLFPCSVLASQIFLQLDVVIATLFVGCNMQLWSSHSSDRQSLRHKRQTPNNIRGRSERRGPHLNHSDLASW